MSRVLSTVGVGTLTLVLLLSFSFTSVSASYVQSPASESSSVNPSNTYTNFIKVKKEYKQFPPRYINYDNLGWTGTLTLVKVDYDHVKEMYIGTYEGYVTCTGLCPMSNLQID